MSDPIIQFSQFRLIPAICRTDQISGNPLQAIDMMSSAIGAFFQTVGRVFMSTIHTAVTVVIDRTIPHIIAVHHVYHRHNRIRIVGCISIDLYIEDMPSAGQIMVRSFYFCFMPGTASIIDRHMIRVRVIFPVGHSRDDSETLFILLSESPAQSFGRSSQYTIIVLPALRKFIRFIPETGYNPDP